MHKFKDTLRIIEEGLLKPMSDADIKRIDDEKLKEVIDEILLRSTKNANGSIDVEGNVDLSWLNLTKIPLKFNKVSDGFSCYGNQLTSLEGSPTKVGGYFDCSNNKLTDLKGSPEKVVDNFQCSFNNLTTLEGVPKEVNGYFYCSNNKVKFNRAQVREVCNVKGKIIV